MRDAIIRRRAFAYGVRDGWRQPHELSTGMTWSYDSPWTRAGANEAYDRGVNLGQRLRAPRSHQRAPTRPTWADVPETADERELRVRREDIESLNSAELSAQAQRAISENRVPLDELLALVIDHAEFD